MDTRTAANGPHTLWATATATATDAAGNVGTAAPVSVTVANPTPAGLVTDVTVSRDGRGTQSTAAFSTTSPGDLLLAFVAADGPGSGGRAFHGVRRRARLDAGQAGERIAGHRGGLAGRSAGVLSSVTVSSRCRRRATTSRSRSSRWATPPGWARPVEVGHQRAPSLSLLSTGAGSWLFGSGNDWAGAVARTLPAGWSMVHQWVDSGPGTRSGPVVGPNLAAGSIVSVAVTAPTNHPWNLVAVEVASAA